MIFARFKKKLTQVGVYLMGWVYCAQSTAFVCKEQCALVPFLPFTITPYFVLPGAILGCPLPPHSTRTAFSHLNILRRVVTGNTIQIFPTALTGEELPAVYPHT